MYDITSFGADPTGAAKSTVAVQSAIDAAVGAGGGTVVVPPGRFVVGTIRLGSHIRLQIEMGATLVASPNFEDFTEESEGHNPPEFPYVRCMIVGFDLEDVEITGGGTLDGAGTAYMSYTEPTFGSDFDEGAFAAMPESRRHEYVCVKSEKRPTWIIFLRRCRNIRLRDFRVFDAARWTTRFSQCENVSVKGLFIENDLRAANCDGMHFTSCRSVIVSDCHIVSGDDCVAVTTYGDDDEPSSGTIISNCIFTSHSAGVRIGLGQKSSRTEDILVADCIFRECNRGVGIFAGPGGLVRNVTLSNLRMSTKLIAGTWWGKAEPILITTLGDRASIEDVEVVNLSARSEQGIVIHAVKGSSITDVRVSNLRLRIGTGPMSPYNAGTLDIRPYAMERKTLPGFYAHRVSGLSLRNWQVNVSAEARQFFKEDISMSECTDIFVEGVSKESR